MIPTEYRCNSCLTAFQTPFTKAYYYLGTAEMGQEELDSQLLDIPMRPAWCKTCAGICCAEDILPLRDFENAYGAARAGKEIDYPVYSEYVHAESIVGEVARYLKWRMKRRHVPRILCCGGTNFQYLDVAQPLIKHAGCEFGFIQGWYRIGSSIPRYYSPAEFRVYDTEGVLIGQLTWKRRENEGWAIEQLSYPAPVDD